MVERHFRSIVALENGFASLSTMADIHQRFSVPVETLSTIKINSKVIEMKNLCLQVFDSFFLEFSQFSIPSNILIV